MFKIEFVTLIIYITVTLITKTTYCINCDDTTTTTRSDHNETSMEFDVEISPNVSSILVDLVSEQNTMTITSQIITTIGPEDSEILSSLTDELNYTNSELNETLLHSRDFNFSTSEAKVIEIAEKNYTTEFQVATKPTNKISLVSKPCNLISLIQCFMEVLDEWAWYLWSFKDNIAAINETACIPYKNMTKCVNFLHCNRQVILNASMAVSDLLVNRNNTLSLLKSYFLVSFPCTEEGMDMVKRNRECLLRNRIGQKISSLSYNMEKEIRLKLRRRQINLNFDVDDEVENDLNYCQLLTTKLTDLYNYVVGKDKCTAEAAYLTCRSVNDAFVNIFPENLHNCSVPCANRGSMTPLDPIPLENDQQENEQLTTTPATSINENFQYLIKINDREPFKMLFLNIKHMILLQRDKDLRQ